MPIQAIPLLQQELEYSCGAASLASLLAYWGVWEGPEAELYPLLGTNCDGTSGEKMMQVAQQFGLIAFSQHALGMDQLREYMADGYTAILSVQAEGEGWEEGHYVVLAGIQLDQVTLMDPSVGEYRQVPIVELMAIWHDYDDAARHEYHGAIFLKRDQIHTLSVEMSEAG